MKGAFIRQIHIDMKTILLGIFLFVSVVVKSQLTFSLTSDTIALCSDVGISGACTIDINNPTSSTIQLNIKRLENEVSPNWFSAICTSELCYPAGVDSVSIDVLPGITEEVKIYFQFFSHNTDTARAFMRFWDDQDSTNQFYHNFYGIDVKGPTTSIASVPVKTFKVYPNPLATTTTVSFSENLINEIMLLTDINGKVLKRYNVNGDSISIRRENLHSGIYFIRFISPKYEVKRLIVQ